MAQSLNPATREALAERVRFYRDLGLTEFYRRPVDPALHPTDEDLSVGTPALLAALATETEEPQTDTSQPIISQEDQPIPHRKHISAAPQIAASVAPADRAAALQMIRDEIGECTRCALHKGRNKLVFADGDPNARLMFVGEGPGADEDAQGLPFVGRAGQLLNNMIGAMGLKREEVYIANVVKCRPPGNRTPEPDEGNT